MKIFSAMRYFAFLLSLFVLCLPNQLVWGQSQVHIPAKVKKMSRKEIREQYEYQCEMQNRLTAKTINGHYIPKDFADCFKQLDSLLTDKQIRAIQSLSNRRDVEWFDMSIGLWIRNHWGLWEGSRLSQYLSHYKLTAPIFQSNAILQYYYDYLHGDFELQFQRDLLNTAYENHSDTLLQEFFENWSKAYQPDTTTTDPYVAEAYKVFYAFYDTLFVKEHYGESQYFVIEPKLHWLGIVDSICLDEGSEEQFVESRPLFTFNKYYVNSVMWDSNMVFFAPIKHSKCLYLTEEYRGVLDDFFPQGNHLSREALEQKPRAVFLSSFVYFYKWSYWTKYHYETDPKVTDITLDVEMKRAYIRYSWLHRNILGYAFMEKRDGQWMLVRMGGDVHVD